MSISDIYLSGGVGGVGGVGRRISSSSSSSSSRRRRNRSSTHDDMRSNCSAAALLRESGKSDGSGRNKRASDKWDMKDLDDLSSSSFPLFTLALCLALTLALALSLCRSHSQYEAAVKSQGPTLPLPAQLQSKLIEAVIWTYHVYVCLNQPPAKEGRWRPG